MGFEASHTSREALDAWLRYRYPARQRTQLAGEAQGPA
jgi:hypothetical protein